MLKNTKIPGGHHLAQLLEMAGGSWRWPHGLVMLKWEHFHCTCWGWLEFPLYVPYKYHLWVFQHYCTPSSRIIFRVFLLLCIAPICWLSMACWALQSWSFGEAKPHQLRRSLPLISTSYLQAGSRVKLRKIHSCFFNCRVMVKQHAKHHHLWYYILYIVNILMYLIDTTNIWYELILFCSP